MKGSTHPGVDVLLVDDDPGVRESVGLALTEQGARVTPAGSLDEARDSLKRRCFSLVLTDLSLHSGHEGLAVAKIARRRAPHARVILFSGCDLAPVAEEAARTAFGQAHTLCIFRQKCGDVPVVEHSGDFYSCDHFVDEKHRLGNIREIPLLDLLESPAQRALKK